MSEALGETIRARWKQPFTVKKIKDGWDSMPSKPGIYIVRSRKAIPRATGVDRFGTLYVGQAKNLRNRLWNVWDAQHEATGMLWDHPAVAAKLLRTRFASSQQRARAVDALIVRVALPVQPADLNRAERAVLTAYVQRFGEPPPLNSVFPGKWSKNRGNRLSRWASRGLTRGV